MVGTKYQRIVGTIEKAFHASHKEILSVSEIHNWILANAHWRGSRSIGKQRISAFLRRRPQFYWHASGRKVNSNVHDHWYSLGPSDETVEMGPRWVQVNVPDMKERMTNLEMEACPHTDCDHFTGHMRLDSFRCIHCQDKVDVLKGHLDKILAT